ARRRHPSAAAPDDAPFPPRPPPAAAARAERRGGPARRRDTAAGQGLPRVGRRPLSAAAGVRPDAADEPDSATGHGRTNVAARGVMKIQLLLPAGEIHRNSTGIFKTALRYAPLTLSTLAALIPPDIDAEV